MTTENERKSRITPGEVLDVGKLVEYGDGAIVSRTVMENDAGTVTLFAFDAEQGLSEHTAPFDALVQVVDGEGEFVIGGKSNNVREGQFILMPAHVPTRCGSIHALR